MECDGTDISFEYKRMVFLGKALSFTFNGQKKTGRHRRTRKRQAE